MIVIAGDAAHSPIGDGARSATELIPDGGPFTIGGGGAFDLERAAGHSPGKRRGKPSAQRSQSFRIGHCSTSRDGARGFTHHQLDRPGCYFGPLSCNELQDRGGGLLTQLTDGLAYAGHRWEPIGGRGQVVETDDRDIARYRETFAKEGKAGAIGCLIVDAEDSREFHSRLDE